MIEFNFPHVVHHASLYLVLSFLCGPIRAHLYMSKQFPKLKRYWKSDAFFPADGVLSYRQLVWIRVVRLPMVFMRIPCWDVVIGEIFGQWKSKVALAFRVPSTMEIISPWSLLPSFKWMCPGVEVPWPAPDKTMTNVAKETKIFGHMKFRIFVESTKGCCKGANIRARSWCDMGIGIYRAFLTRQEIIKEVTGGLFAPIREWIPHLSGEQLKPPDSPDKWTHYFVTSP